MNNRFKFRVWDKLEKKYIDFEHFKKGNVEFNFHKKTNEIWVEYDKKRYVFEQNTGLQDKNGKDIYEGDMLKTTPIMDDKDYFVKVYHNGVGFISNGALNEFQARHSEVVGNIHKKESK